MNIHKISPLINFTAKNTFRDRELFDEEKDIVNDGYRIYDDNDYYDLPKSNIYLADGYGSLYEATSDPRLNIDTSPLFYPMYSPFLDDRICDSNCSFSEEQKRKLRDICTLKEKSKKVYNHDLYNYIIFHNYKGIPFENLIKISKICKLKRADKTEYFDKEMFEAGLYCLDKFALKDVNDIKRLMKTFVTKDKSNNEIFLKESFVYVKKHKFRNIEKLLKNIDK